MTSPPHTFRLESVAVDFGSTRALDGIDLEIAPGEAVGFVGPSGSGKTTLLRLLNGTQRPTTGTVHVSGAPLHTLEPRQLRELRAKVGFIHQDLRLVPNLRVVSNVLMGRFGHSSLLGALRTLLFPSRAAVLEAHEILERVGIGEKLYERSDRLSGGQRQRVAIARALYQGPEALLADEPVSSVDPARARDTVGLLTEVSRERGLTLCMSLHNLDLAREFFTRLVGLRNGTVQFDRQTTSLNDAEFAALYELEAEEIVERAHAK